MLMALRMLRMVPLAGLRAAAFGRPLAALAAPPPPPRRAAALRPATVLVRAVTPAPGAADAPPPPPPNFEALGLSSELLDAVREAGLSTPTDIQAAAVPALLRDRRSDFLLAAQTGSGKTLAYLLPLVHALKEGEALDGPPSKPRRPRALVLGPTRELTEQIAGVARRLSHAARFRPALATGGPRGAAALARPVDVLVATPARAAAAAAAGALFYGDVEVIVLDEADTMLDAGFGDEVAAILAALRSKPAPARAVLVSATMTAQVAKLVAKTFPSLRRVETAGLHRGVPGAAHAFLPVPPGSDKIDLLVQVVAGDAARGRRALVFCNTLGSARAVGHALAERGLPAGVLHGDVPPGERADALAAFSRGADEAGATAASNAAAAFNSAYGDAGDADPAARLLVATDLAARGLDIPGGVDHVINFDFPLNSVDYLHRTGRTARAGRPGKVTSLVAKGDRVLAERIREALGRGEALDALSAKRGPPPAAARGEDEAREERRGSGRGGRGGRGGRRGGFGRGGDGGGAPPRGTRGAARQVEGGGGRGGFGGGGGGGGSWGSSGGRGGGGRDATGWGGGGGRGGGRGGGGRGGGSGGRGSGRSSSAR
jgi:superfamily II DNA/RNA helicase